MARTNPLETILTHKVRNPQNIDHWLNIWDAHVSSTYDDDNLSNLELRENENIIINPSEHWQIPVNQIIHTSVDFKELQPQEFFYDVYIRNNNDYIPYTEANLPDPINREDFFYEKNNQFISFSLINPFSESNLIRSPSEEEPISDENDTNDETENEEKIYSWSIRFEEEVPVDIGTNIYNITTQTSANQSINDFSGQIAVFDTNGLIIPLQKNNDVEDDTNRFLTSNNDWKLQDEYKLDIQDNETVDSNDNYVDKIDISLLSYNQDVKEIIETGNEEETVIEEKIVYNDKGSYSLSHGENISFKKNNNEYIINSKWDYNNKNQSGIVPAPNNQTFKVWGVDGQGDVNWFDVDIVNGTGGWQLNSERKEIVYGSKLLTIPSDKIYTKIEWVQTAAAEKALHVSWINITYDNSNSVLVLMPPTATTDDPNNPTEATDNYVVTNVTYGKTSGNNP